jgi:hypothetical protein
VGRAAAFAPALTLAGRERMPTPRCCAWRRRRCSRALARPTPPTPPSPRRACGPCRHPTPTPHGTEAAAAVPALRWPRGRCCRFDDALAAERVRNLSAPRRRRRRAHARTQGSARPSRAVLPSSVRGRESYTSWLAGPGTASHRVITIIRVANGHLLLGGWPTECAGCGGGGGLRSPHGIDRRLAEGVVEI